MGPADRLAQAFITTCFIVAIGYVLFWGGIIGTLFGLKVYRTNAVHQTQSEGVCNASQGVC